MRAEEHPASALMHRAWKVKKMSFVYFDALFPGSSDGSDLGYVALALFPGGKFDPEKGPTQKHFFAWPSEKDDLVAFCLQNTDKDIYTVPALFRNRGNRKASNIAHQWAVYADADDLDVRKVLAEPTMVVETSYGRHHLYWVTSTDNPRALMEISRSVAHTHAADGCDPSGWDAGQLLRVPGTTNNKTAEPFTVRLLRTGNPYAIEALKEVYPPVVSVPRRITSGNEMPDLKNYNQECIKESSQVFHYNVDIYSMFADELVEGQDRSATMWRLLSEMSRSGVSRNTAMYIAWEAKCNKYRLDNRSEEDLWNELCRAYEDPDNQPVTNSLDAADRSIVNLHRSLIDASERNPERQAKDFAETITLLRNEERDSVPDDTFVDRYQHWATTRTDAPDVYHRAGAITLLTSVFGEFGSCPTKFDSNLTLWVLLLGPTTRARKTTAMMLWVDLLTEMEDERFRYLIGSDVTSEALSVILPKKDGRSSVFYRDEAHGLLYEQEKKRYLVGLREHMTELYGGRVRMRVRASMSEEDQPRGNIRTNFVMFLCGTMNQVTQALTIDDYQSGHLARFLVAEADPPPMTKDDMYIDQYDGVDRSDDLVRRSLVNDLTASRQFWLGEVRGFGHPKMIPFAQDAWARYLDVKWDIYETALKHELSEVLLPTTDRMGTSVMKCAILLAMSEKKKRVEMRHVMKSIALAEEWYSATATIAGRILHSSWSARQEELLAAVKSRTDGITQQELYSRYRTRMQEKDIESDLNVLMKAGLIKKIAERGRIRYIAITRL